MEKKTKLNIEEEKSFKGPGYGYSLYKNNLPKKTVGKELIKSIIIIISLFVNIIFLVIILNNLRQNIKVKEEIEDFRRLKKSIQNFKNRINKPGNEQDNVLKILSYFSTKEKIGQELIRILPDYKDGNYIALNDTSIKIAYSFGISNFYPFEEGLAQMGIDIYMYDHTIEYLVKPGPKFHWSKIGITGDTTKHYKNLKTLKELLEMNGHLNEDNMLLKIDIEGGEWEVFSNMEEDILNKFSQILVEFHLEGILNKANDYSIFIKALDNLNRTHQMIHTHCVRRVETNLVSHCGQYEITSIKRKGNKFRNDYNFYPIFPLDKNRDGTYDRYLGLIGLLAID